MRRTGSLGDVALAERRAPGALRGPARVLVVGIWLVAAVLVLGVARITAVGPVVLTLGNRRGVHLGDLAAMALIGVAAAALTGPGRGRLPGILTRLN